jgi:hypothetical protein
VLVAYDTCRFLHRAATMTETPEDISSMISLSLLGYRTVRTCIECRSVVSVFFAKAIRYLDTE